MTYLRGVIERDVDGGLYDGAVTVVAVDGRVVFDEAIGFADRLGGRPMRRDSVFPIFSIAKSISAVAVLQQVERGQVRLNTPVCEIIPEFARRGKQRVTLGHLLCHSGGMPAGFPAVAPERAGDLDAVVEAICDVELESVPGEEVSYSSTMAYAVLGQCVRVLDGGARRFRDIVRDDILTPLGMNETSVGMPPTLAGRAVVPRVSDTSPGLFDAGILMRLASLILDPAKDVEMPAGGFVSTAGDVHRFAEALRQGGTLEGERSGEWPTHPFGSRQIVSMVAADSKPPQACRISR